MPSLPARHEDPAGALSRLGRLAAKYPGAAAFESGRFVGFLIGLCVETFKGSRPGVYVPEWAHGASGEKRPEVYRRLYRHLAGEWVAAGHVSHGLTAFAHDREELEAWFELGFGMLAEDCVRPLAPVRRVEAGGPSAQDALTVRPAEAADLATWLPLAREFRAYVTGSPIFLHVAPPDETSEREWMSQPGHILWLAFRKGRLAGFMRSEPSSDDAAFSITDPATVSITGAYTLEAHRGGGVGARLLGAAVDWARENGYERCSVDFETANPLGSRFWRRHFEPVCRSVIRHVDDRVAPTALTPG